MNEKNATKFKEALGNYPTGVTIVTMMTEDNIPLGLTVNSFASVSIDPLLILWSIDKRVSTYNHFTNSKKFAVHILASDQSELCYLFAARDVDRFSNCEWETSEYKLPILKNVAAILQCETYQTIEAGDHMIILGKVVDITGDNRAPLLYHKRHTGEIPSQFYNEK
jgi:flavin reductase (DIM6/NTAB) family NADH-FMN oxidoreductase RutF